ncbi:MAG: hypothetical protein ACK4S8_15480 [Alishewanella aestuarii]
MDPKTVIAKIEAYAGASGLKVSTVCQRAFGNPHYLARLRGRLERLNGEIERFDQFAAQHPPPKSSEDAA